MTTDDALQIESEINTLVQGWTYRDLSMWDKLRSLFHPGASIEVTWFTGTASDFIDGSQKMAGSKLRTKHMIGYPLIDRQGDRAIAETSAIIIVDNQELGLACNGYSRFYDLIERRDGAWKIWKRYCLYDLAAFTFPRGPVEIDQALLDRFPSEYAPLAYLLQSGGFPVDHVFPTRGSEREAQLKREGARWLQAKC